MQMEKLCIILRYAAKMLWLPTDGKVNQNCVNRLCISKLPYTSYIPESAFLLLLLTSLVGTPFFEAIRSESSSFYPHWPIPSTQALHYRGLFTLLWSPFVPTLVLSGGPQRHTSNSPMFISWSSNSFQTQPHLANFPKSSISHGLL